SKSVGLAISGLAYAPDSGHLLVMENSDNSYDVTVLDALNNYEVLGTIQVNDGGTPVLGGFSQAGMEFDCLGNLWVVNQFTGVVYSVDSGENFGCAVDIPWLSEDPTSGTLSVGAAPTQPVTLTFDGGTLLPGLRRAQLRIKTDTPLP